MKYRVEITARKETDDWSIVDAGSEDEAAEIAVGNFIELLGHDWEIDVDRVDILLDKQESK